ncbi:MAG: hypothetical protein M1814_005474, partial [Vezdaea aestivalis]
LRRKPFFCAELGLQVTIPNEQLIVPEYTLYPAGRNILNTSIRGILLNGLEEVKKNDKLVLGQIFLTQIYLLVNGDAAQFTTWQSNATLEKETSTLGEGLSVQRPRAVQRPPSQLRKLRRQQVQTKWPPSQPVLLPA